MIIEAFYLIGKAVRRDGIEVYVILRLSDASRPEIVVQDNSGPASESWEFGPKDAEEFRPKFAKYTAIGNKVKFLEVAQEPPGWFERKCREANCEWFVPLVKRMAAGEQVPMEEIQSAYFVHNGKPMPCGKWSEIFK